MRDAPSPELVALLARLGLATSDDLQAVRRRARSLARGLPLFDSVWVDALAAARRLTPFQAGEINAGRGPQLGVGPYVVVTPAEDLGYARLFAVREIATGRPARLLLLSRAQRDWPEVQTALQRVVARLAPEQGAGVARPLATGLDEARAWVEFAPVVGTTAAEWMVRNGRFPPQVVLEVARQMTAALAALEGRDVVHGDLTPAGLLLDAQGCVHLPPPGVRAIIRPAEGYAHTDLPPAAYDALAPERVEEGTPPDRAGDLYAAGCLWWQLLTGRTPLPGGNALARLKSVQAGRIPDVRRLAPETPEPLVRAIAACTHRAPDRRGASFAALAARLGPSTADGRLALERSLAETVRPTLTDTVDAVRQSRHTPVWTAALAGCLLSMAAVTWPLWRGTTPPPLAQIGGPPTAAADAPSGPLLASAVPSGALSRPGDPSAGRPAAEAPRADGRPPPPADLVLPGDRPHTASRLALRAGQRVRPPRGARATLLVGPRGLPVDVADVTFDSIDFVAPTGAEAAPAALVEVRAACARFRNCTFRAGRESVPPVGVAWTRPAGDPQRLPPRGALRLESCALRGVAAGIDCRAAGPLEIELYNVLHLGPGPLVRLARARGLDEPLAMTLDTCTLRDAAGMLDLHYRDAGRHAGRVAIGATGCVFHLREGAGLVQLAGPQSPGRLLSFVEWSGGGSLLDGHAPFAVWFGGDGRALPLDDALVAIDGLVRGSFRFAGADADDPAASELTDWNAPLRSPDPPGIRAEMLLRGWGAADRGQGTEDR